MERSRNNSKRDNFLCENQKLFFFTHYHLRVQNNPWIVAGISWKKDKFLQRKIFWETKSVYFFHLLSSTYPKLSMERSRNKLETEQIPPDFFGKPKIFFCFFFLLITSTSKKISMERSKYVFYVYFMSLQTKWLIN